MSSTGDCSGSLLWHRVCGPAVVSGLSQQIFWYQRTPALHQEAHINHRYMLHFSTSVYVSVFRYVVFEQHFNFTEVVGEMFLFQIK